MRIFGTVLAAAALAATAAATPASAAPVVGGAHLGAAVPGLTETVQWRRHYHGPRYYHRHRGGNAAAGVAAGLAAGAILGGVIASQAAQPRYAAPGVITPEDIAWCAQRYRSYDARTGTYLGYDGYRHPCP